MSSSMQYYLQHKVTQMLRNVLHTLQVATKWPVRDRNGWSEERVEQAKYIGEWFQEIFARQISEVQLHRRRLQSKVCKNLKVGAQR